MAVNYMKFQFPQTLKGYIFDFAKLYHRYRVESEKLRSVRYQIISTLTDYKRTQKIKLSITDCPGDVLPPMSIKQIKEARDILSQMHPIDVNSINDLYYLAKDKIVEVKVSGEKIMAITQQGVISEYDINDQIDLDKIVSSRLSYMIGSMQAEKLIRETYKKDNRYKIIKDHITTLHVLDNKTSEQLLKKPLDILFSDEYKLYSKEDVAKIGYICGQMTKIN